MLSFEFIKYFYLTFFFPKKLENKVGSNNTNLAIVKLVFVINDVCKYLLVSEAIIFFLIFFYFLFEKYLKSIKIRMANTSDAVSAPTLRLSWNH